MPMEFRRVNILGLEIGDDSHDGILTGNGRMLVLILLGFTVLNYAYHGLFRPLFTDKVDFEAYYNAALTFKHGGFIYDLMIAFFREGPAKYDGPFPYVYPPAFAVFLSPLAYFEFNHAVLLWIFTNQILFFMGVFLLLKTISKQYSRTEFLALVFVCFNFRPLFIDYLVGQCNVLLFFFMVITLYFYRSNKDVYAGASLAIACMIKVIPLFLLAFFLWKRAYKVVVASSLILLFIFLYSLLFFDIELYLWYFKFMANQTLFNAYHDNHSLTGFFTRMLTHTIWTKGIFNNLMAARICIALSVLITLIFFFFVIRKKCKRRDDRFLREYSLAIVTMLLLSQMTSTPYLVMLLAPIGIWVNELFKYRVGTYWALLTGLAYGIVTIWYPPAVDKFLNMNIYGIFLNGFLVNIFSIQFLALSILWCYFAFAPFSEIPDHTDGKIYV